MERSELSRIEVGSDALEKPLEGRLRTGIVEFDNLIEGGIPRGYMVVLAGSPGTGKTIFASQFLNSGLKNGEPGVYVSFAEDRKTFVKNMGRMGLKFAEYENDGLFKYLDFVTVKGEGVDTVLQQIFETSASVRVKRLVIDSISALNQAFSRKIDARVALHSILGKISRAMDVTTLLVAETPMGSGIASRGAEEFVADGVITLDQHLRGFHLDRWIRVVKMRGTNANLLQHRYRINGNGLVVYPHTEAHFIEKISTERADIGIDGLDQMLGGGVFRGTITKVAGASGTGKTTLGLHFVQHGAKLGEKGLLVSFEEPVQQLIRHGEGFGWRFRQLVEEGQVKMVSYYPEPYNVDELLLHLETLIREQQPSRFVLDSITKLERILPEDEYVQYIRSMQFLLKEAGVTSLLTSAEENGEPSSRVAVSTLMDNILSLRHVEIESALRRSLVIFKARGTAHDRDIREFEITMKGIVVKEKFTGLEQVLGGSPRRTVTEEVAESWAKAFGGKT